MALQQPFQSYVYENVEVKLTGRTASKKLKSGKIDELVEITPIHSIEGSWLKWVREVELFEVQG